MKVLKLGIAAIAIMIGITSSSFTTKIKKAVGTVFFWYSIPAASHGIFTATLTAAYNLGYTLVKGTHVTAIYGYTVTLTNTPGAPKVYTLYKL